VKNFPMGAKTAENGRFWSFWSNRRKTWVSPTPPPKTPKNPEKPRKWPEHRVFGHFPNLNPGKGVFSIVFEGKNGDFSGFSGRKPRKMPKFLHPQNRDFSPKTGFPMPPQDPLLTTFIGAVTKRAFLGHNRPTFRGR